MRYLLTCVVVFALSTVCLAKGEKLDIPAAAPDPEIDKILNPADAADPFGDEEVYRVGLQVGMSTIKADAASGGVNTGYLSNIFVGLLGDFSFTKNIGIDADFYYGFAPTTLVGNYNVSLRQLGFSAILKYQYPFVTGQNTQWFPMIGAGLGASFLKYNFANAVTAAADSDLVSAYSPLIYFGLKCQPSRVWWAQLDYTQSLMAGGQDSVGATGLAAELDGLGFSRIRLGVFFPMSDALTLGAQYTRRTFGYNGPTPVPTPPGLYNLRGNISTNANQFMVLGTYKL